MSTLTPFFLNLEFFFLWSVRLLLRVTAVGIVITSAPLTLVLFLSAGALELAMDALQERTRITSLHTDIKNLSMSISRNKEILP